MKTLLYSFIAFGFIITGCAHKEEVKTDVSTEATTAAASEEKGSCEKADCKCNHHKKEAKCAECQKSGKECDSCKKKHEGCKECADKGDAKATDKKAEPKKKSK